MGDVNPLTPRNDQTVDPVDSLSKDKRVARRTERSLKTWFKLAGLDSEKDKDHISMNEGIYKSEAGCADMNNALGYMMKDKESFPPYFNYKRDDIGDLDNTLSFYFQQCSIYMNAHTNAVIGATLANGGMNPITHERVFKAKDCQSTLSVMQSAGMYDYSGQWAYHVGVPAKSGVGGSVMIVIPNVMAITIFSPKLDANGNSYRAIEAAKRMGQIFKTHPFDVSPKTELTRPKKFSEYSRIESILFAASKGDIFELAEMQSRGWEMTVKDYDQRTALHLAAAEGHPKTVESLIKMLKPDDLVKWISSKDRWNRTPLDDAIRGVSKGGPNQQRFNDVVRILQKAGGAECSPDKHETSASNKHSDVTPSVGVVPVLFAAANGDVHELIKLAAAGANLFEADYDFRTAAHLAASNGQVDAFKYLLYQARATGNVKRMLNATDRWGNTCKQDALRGDCNPSKCEEITELIDDELKKAAASKSNLP